MSTPMVMVTVEGGIATAQVIRGDVDVIEWDWDVIDETNEPREIEAAIAEAERLPDDYPGRSIILNQMRERLLLLDL